MDNLLEIKNLNKTIGSLKLTDINLTLEPGYIMGLIGRNGAGKTSLIKTILRLYQKDSGEVFINGHSMDTQEPVSYTHLPHLPAHLTEPALHSRTSPLQVLCICRKEPGCHTPSLVSAVQAIPC